MLDMGFIRDVRKIVGALPPRRHSLLFSATMPAEVAKLAAESLHNPVRVEVTPQKIPVERIAQSGHPVTIADTRALLEKLLRDPALSRVLLFTPTKHPTNTPAEQIAHARLQASTIHGKNRTSVG